MKIDLNGSLALVTGGASGIGEAIAIGLAEAGADVVPVGRDIEKIKKTCEIIKKMGRKTMALTVDVTKKESLEKMAGEIVSEFGKIDILVNSAGTHKKKPTLDVLEEEWDTIIDTNLKGSFLACQVVGKQMIEQKKGNIINIGSLGSFVALSEATAYCASKAGVVALTRSLAVEWVKHNIRVNVIIPGNFRTPLNTKILDLPGRLENIVRGTPMGRLGKLEELAGMAVFLASDASSYVTGQDFTVDGGFLASARY